MSVTPSVSTTGTQSATPSTTMAYSDVFDNTEDGTNPILTDSWAVVNGTTLFAVSFALSEADVSCGPGLYLLTHVMLALKRAVPTTSTLGVLLQVREGGRVVEARGART